MNGRLRTEYGHSGVKLFAPIDYWNTPEDEVDLVTGGCGPGGFGDKLVPDSILGASVYEACRIHDWMYAVGQTEADRNEADRVFRNNMQRLVDARGGILRRVRTGLVVCYYLAVHLCGASAFWNGKNNDNEMGFA